MSNVRWFILISMVLSGCAGPQGGLSPAGWSWPFAPTRSPVATMAGADVVGGQSRYAQFSFDWQLSGDPQVMPLQVFDDGVGMWLQFAPEGAWPAVFEISTAGLRPLSYQRESPYMRLDSVYEHLELRGGHLRGSVRKAKATQAVNPQPVQEAPLPAPMPLVSSAAPDELPAASVAASSLVQASEPDIVVPGVAVVIAEQADHKEGAGKAHYAVSPADLTMRQALERWARLSSWTFSAEHWAVDVDIPLVGEASFETDFKSAVRELLAATEMGERPLQPCFYSNRVLRVVPHAQACDRRGGARAVS